MTLIARAAAIVGGGIFTFPVAFVGYLVEYLAWTLGFGAAILVWHRHHRRTEGGRRFIGNCPIRRQKPNETSHLGGKDHW